MATQIMHSNIFSAYRGKRVLVTGHTGFKGAWLTEWLLNLGCDVMGYALAPPTSPNLHSLLKHPQRMHSIEGDIVNLEHVSKQIAHFKPEIVFHLAAQALVRASYQDPVGTYATNVMGTVNVLQACRQVASLRAIVVVTSDKCYENREWDWPYRENDPMGGYDPYSNSKGCAELVTAAFRSSFFGTGKAGLASARAGNVIGGGDWAQDRLVPDCIRAIGRGDAVEIRNPNAIRPWQHVLEPLWGYLTLGARLLSDADAAATGWNFGPDVQNTQPVSWIADRIVQIWGKGATWKYVAPAEQLHEAKILRLDSSLAKIKLHWRPILSIAETIDWTLEWYRGHFFGEDPLSLTQQQIERYQSRIGE